MQIINEFDVISAKHTAGTLDSEEKSFDHHSNECNRSVTK